MEQAGPEAQPDGDSYNFVIALPALKHMQSMYERGFVPSKTTYNELLVACARVHRTRFAVALLKELKVAALWHSSKDFPSFGLDISLDELDLTHLAKFLVCRLSS
jgi:hypothetical protein